MLFTYSTLSLLDNHVKIADLPTKAIVEIYQKKKNYIDPTFFKHQTLSSSKEPHYSIKREIDPLPSQHVIEVSQSGIMGKLSLRIA